MRDPHCEDGHLNIYVRDHDSIVTGKGQHARVVAFFSADGNNEPCCRVDYCHKGLRPPTDSEILTVLKAEARDQGIRGRWKVSKRESYFYTYSREEVQFKPVK